MADIDIHVDLNGLVRCLHLNRGRAGREQQGRGDETTNSRSLNHGATGLQNDVWTLRIALNGLMTEPLLNGFVGSAVLAGLVHAAAFHPVENGLAEISRDEEGAEQGGEFSP